MKPQPQQHHLPALLHHAGLRPTRQRLALAAALFDGKPRHVTAEQVYADMRAKRAKVSLATVYNALHSFTEAGLLREVVIDSSRVYFDTNIAAHHHFFDQATGKLHDVPATAVRIAKLPKLPAGRELDRVEVIIRLR
jgi:Fur family iron response transcriptional regulator